MQSTKGTTVASIASKTSESSSSFRLSSASNKNDTDTNTISSGISVRHGIIIDHLKLLTDGPPETKITTLTCHPKSESTSGPDDTIMDTETGDEVQRHSDLWFEDGSVICRAENTLFCVHISQLARHSLVFHDMFMLPQPEPTDLDPSFLLRPETKWAKATRRVPVVYLYDKAEDVANLLTALYDGLCFGNNDENDFRVVSGILRLSTKYLIDSLRSKASMHLSVAWPSDLKAWDAREDLARHGEGPKQFRYPHPASVISLAREVDVPCLLPAAFYDLSRNSFAQILEPNEDDGFEPPPSPLSEQDMRRLCLGKEAAQHTITTLIQSMGRSHFFRHTQKHPLNMHGKRVSFSICISAAACRKDFNELVNLATQHYLFDRERGYCDPLYVAEELGQLKSAEFSECKACAIALELWAAREREKMWKMIPYWFRLEPLGANTSSPPPA